MTAPPEPAPGEAAPDAPMPAALAVAAAGGWHGPMLPGRGGRAATVVSLRWSAWNTAAVVAACVLAGSLLAWEHVHRPRQAAELLDGAAVSRAPRERINPNADTTASLRRLPGIGPARAKAIVAYREGRGGRAFRDASDLTNIRGIGPATAAKVAETGWLSFSDANGMAKDGEVTKH